MTSPYLCQPLRSEAEARAMTDQPTTAPTPGPYLVNADGDDILIEAPDNVPICDVFNPDRTPEENLANAYLLAASWETAAERDRLVKVNEKALTACRNIIAWFESEKTGPDYGSLDRKTHPHGEAIWKQWWDNQLALCDQTEHTARAALDEACKS